MRARGRRRRVRTRWLLEQHGCAAGIDEGASREHGNRLLPVPALAGQATFGDPGIPLGVRHRCDTSEWKIKPHTMIQTLIVEPNAEPYERFAGPQLDSHRHSGRPDLRAARAAIGSQAGRPLVHAVDHQSTEQRATFGDLDLNRLRCLDHCVPRRRPVVVRVPSVCNVHDRPTPSRTVPSAAAIRRQQSSRTDTETRPLSIVDVVGNPEARPAGRLVTCDIKTDPGSVRADLPTTTARPPRTGSAPTALPRHSAS